MKKKPPVAVMVMPAVKANAAVKPLQKMVTQLSNAEPPMPPPSPTMKEMMLPSHAPMPEVKRRKPPTSCSPPLLLPELSTPCSDHEQFLLRLKHLVVVKL